LTPLLAMSIAGYDGVMRILIILLIFFSIPKSRAFEISQFSAKFGLSKIAEGKPWTFLGTQAIFTDELWTKQLLLIDNVPGKLASLQLIKENNFIIVQIPRSKETFLSMALVGFSEEEIRNHISQTSYLKKILNELNPLPSAYAQNENCQVRGTSHLMALEEIGTLFANSVTSGATNCLIPLLQGAWDSTGGLAVGAWDGLKHLVNDPKEFWKDKVEQMQNLKAFIAEFDTKMKEMGQTFMRLPAQTKTMFICSFAGGLGAGALLGILSGGAAMSGALAQMTLFIQKLTQLERVFALLDKVGKLRSIDPQFIQRLSNGRVGNDLIFQLDLFARYKLPDIITGAMSCIL
jgi:hypothetical protein